VVLALVEEEAGLLPFPQIGLEDDASLVDGDETVKMGKRAGNAIDLDTVISDIGPVRL